MKENDAGGIVGEGCLIGRGCIKKVQSGAGVCRGMAAVQLRV